MNLSLFAASPSGIPLPSFLSKQVGSVPAEFGCHWTADMMLGEDGLVNNLKMDELLGKMPSGSFVMLDFENQLSGLGSNWNLLVNFIDTIKRCRKARPDCVFGFYGLNPADNSHVTLAVLSNVIFHGMYRSYSTTWNPKFYPEDEQAWWDGQCALLQKWSQIRPVV